MRGYVLYPLNLYTKRTATYFELLEEVLVGKVDVTKHCPYAHADKCDGERIEPCWALLVERQRDDPPRDDGRAEVQHEIFRRVYVLES